MVERNLATMFLLRIFTISHYCILCVLLLYTSVFFNIIMFHIICRKVNQEITYWGNLTGKY